MEDITLTHWLLSFAGATIAILLKVIEMQKMPGYTFGAYVKKYWISIIVTAIMIPVLLITISDTSLKELLPINNLTALLSGYQTQEMFKTITNLGKSKYSKNEP